jgi:hypothetical protein
VETFAAAHRLTDAPPFTT